MPVISLEISGNDKQETRSGYNILKVTRDNFTENGITFTNNQDGSFTLNGTSTTLFYIDLNNSAGNRFTLTQNKKYFLYFAESSKQGISLTARISETTSGITVSTKGIRDWVNATSDNGFAFMTITKGTTFNNETFYPMVAESDVELEYEAYGAMPSPEYPSEIETVNTQANIIICNKNFLKLDDIEETTINGITYSIKNGIVKLKGTATNGVDITLKRNIKLKSNTYTHSVNTILQGMYLSFDNISNSSLSYEAGTEKHFKIETETTYNRYILWINNGTTLDLELKIQLETGEIKTDFAVPKQQTKVVDIQQEMLEGDYFVKEADGWKEVHGWNEQVLDGTENFRTITGDTNKYYFGIQNFGDNMNYAQKSNYFKGGKSFWGGNEEGVYIGANRELVFGVSLDNKEGINDLETWKNWLAQKYNEGNPVYIWYKLATLLKLACTEKQSAQLDDLLNTSTYKNVTHIYSTDKVSPIIKVVYRKDTPTLLNNICKLIIENGGI